MSDDELPDPEDVIASYNPNDEEDEIGEDLPTSEDIVGVHDKIERIVNLKYTGARVAVPKLEYRRLLEEVDEYDGVYYRAAALLRKITTAHYFEDANKRTAWVTTRTYLEEQGERPAETEIERVDHVMKSLRSYTIEEIAEWLETGEIDEESLNPR